MFTYQKQDVKEPEKLNDLHIHDILKEYSRIDQHWLNLHYSIMVGLVIFAWLVECGLGFMLLNSDMMLTSVQRFLIKYNVMPSAANLLILGVCSIIMGAKNVTQTQKMYAVSLSLTAICFVLFTAHNVFTTTYYLFALSIMLTTIYASYKVTIITAVASLTGLIVSEVYIKWNLEKPSIFESTQRMGDFLISIFMLLAFSFICMMAIMYERLKNEASISLEIERRQLEKSLELDELTGIYNRKALERYMNELRVNPSDGDTILAMVDLDHFKGINDNWGHHLGDYCLVEFAKVMKKNAKDALCFRYGGDEFCILFKDSSLTEALNACKRIQSALKLIKVEGANLGFSASFGLARLEADMDVALLFMQADRALYHAKEVRSDIKIFQSI